MNINLSGADQRLASMGYNMNNGNDVMTLDGALTSIDSTLQSWSFNQTDGVLSLNLPSNVLASGFLSYGEVQTDGVVIR